MSDDRHYRTLGVGPDANAGEIRAAYRRLAREYHPDAMGGAPSPRMADINEAWHVLSDPGRRAIYDAGRRSRAEAQRATDREPAVGKPTVGERPMPPRPSGPPRFPWRGVVIASAVASAGVLMLSLLRPAPTVRPVDNILRPGSCVQIEPNGDAREVLCRGPHDAVVRDLVPFEDRCPFDTDTHRDRQGRGWACVVPVVVG